MTQTGPARTVPDTTGPTHRIAAWGPGEVGMRTGHTNPVTTASVRAVLDATPAVVAAGPGVLVDDTGPHHRHDDPVRPS